MMEIRQEENQESIESLDNAMDVSQSTIVETEEISKIKSKFIYYMLLSLGFGLLFGFCFYDFYENFSGIIYPIFVIGLYSFMGAAIYGLDKKVRRDSYYSIVIGIILGISTCLTENSFVIFFNTLGIGILFTIFLCKQFYEEKEWGILRYAYYGINIWIHMLCCLKYPFHHGYPYVYKVNKKSTKWIPIVKGIILGILFLIIILPLLGSADMVFARLLDHTVSNLLRPFSVNGIYYFILFVCGTLGFYGILCSLGKGKFELRNSVNTKREAVSIMVMTVIVAVTYFIFALIQVLYLFGGDLFHLPEGITYAEYAQQGFFQLLFVVVINISMVLFFLERYVEHKLLKTTMTVISGCTFVMIASAMYRMLLYVNVYHLTFLRVLVLWFLTVLVVVMIGVTYYIYHNKFAVGRFIFYIVLSFYLVFSFMRPDYIIASYNINHMEVIDMNDLYYLTSLSDDATPALVNIKETQLNKSTDDMRGQYTQKISHLESYYSLKKEYYKIGLRYFNYSNNQAYHIAMNKLKSFE